MYFLGVTIKNLLKSETRSLYVLSVLGWSYKLSFIHSRKKFKLSLLNDSFGKAEENNEV